MDRNSLDYEPGEVSNRLMRLRSGQYESDEEKDDSDKKVNMSEELKYRENMEVKISDSLATFKEAEKERIQREKDEREVLERKKQEKLEKERIRLKREEERKMEIQKQLEEKERLRKLKEEEEAKNRIDSDSDDDHFVNKHQLNLTEEFKYRQEMETKVSDRLGFFKQVESESKEKSKAELEDLEKKKNEKREKEQIRLRKEEERKLQTLKQIEEKERLRKLQEEENPKHGNSSGDSDNEDGYSNKHQLNLEKEFQYRDEMETKVSEKLGFFKQVENESKTKSQIEREENERKRQEKQQKEEERLRREEIRKLKIQEDIEKRKEEKMKEEENRNLSFNQEDGDHEHIRREREIMENVEKEFLKQGFQGNKGSSKTVLKRWNEDNTEENNNIDDNNKTNKRRSSSDSGIVNEDAVECVAEESVECSPGDPDYERKLLEETEKAFKQYVAKHRTSSTGSKNVSEQKNERSSSFGTSSDPRRINEYSDIVVKARQPSNKNAVDHNEPYKREKSTDSLSSNEANLNEEQSKSLDDEKSSILEKLEIAEKKVSEAQYSLNYSKQLGGDTSDAEEEYHAVSLELSRLKKRLKQVESETAALQKKNKDSIKLSRECKVPLDKAPPPVNANDFNDDGDCVPEGIITHRLRSLSKKMH